MCFAHTTEALWRPNNERTGHFSLITLTCWHCPSLKMKNHSCLETMGAARAEIDICRSLTCSHGSSISHHPLIHLLSQGWKPHWLLHYNHNKVKRKLIELHNGQALNGPSLLVYNASELDVKDQSVRVSWLNTHLNIDQSVKKFIFQKPTESCFRGSFNTAVHLTATCLLKDSYQGRAIAHCRLNESHSYPQ